MNNPDDKIFYVYMWYYKDTGAVFYIGKGQGRRWLDVSSRRNRFFKRIVSKFKDEVAVKKYAENMTEDEAYALEKKLIEEYWRKGECKANLAEGGRGGNTGNTYNYESPEKRRKLSEFAKTRTGEKNPMWGHTHTEEARRKIGDAQKGKKLSEEHIKRIREANLKENREKYHPITDETRRKLSQALKGRHYKETNPALYEKMMDRDCPYHYYVELNGEVVFDSISSTKMEKFCEDELHISRTIVYKAIFEGWTPKFKRHQHLKTLKIYRVKRSVSTSPDECKGVGSEISADSKCMTTDDSQLKR